jgi:hypothetical protein
MVLEEALQQPLRRRFISAWRNGYAIRPDQLLKQPFQVALERVDEPAHIMRRSAGHREPPKRVQSECMLLRIHVAHGSNGFD